MCSRPKACDSMRTRRTAERDDGEPVQLTYVEFEILRSLMRSPSHVLSRRALLESVWEGFSADYREQRTIDVHIRHLREKLESDPLRASADPHRARRRVPLRRMIREALQHPGRLRMRLTVVAAASALFALVVLAALVLPSLQHNLGAVAHRLAAHQRGRRRSPRSCLPSVPPGRA